MSDDRQCGACEQWTRMVILVVLFSFRKPPIVFVDKNNLLYDKTVINWLTHNMLFVAYFLTRGVLKCAYVCLYYKFVTHERVNRFRCGFCVNFSESIERVLFCYLLIGLDDCQVMYAQMHVVFVFQICSVCKLNK